MNSQIVSNRRRHPIIMRNCDVNLEVDDDRDNINFCIPNVPIEMNNCTLRVTKTKQNQGCNSPMLENVSPPELSECTSRPFGDSNSSCRMQEADQELASQSSAHSALSSHEEPATVPPPSGTGQILGAAAVAGGVAGLTIGAGGGFDFTTDDVSDESSEESSGESLDESSSESSDDDSNDISSEYSDDDSDDY